MDNSIFLGTIFELSPNLTVNDSESPYQEKYQWYHAKKPFHLHKLLANFDKSFDWLLTSKANDRKSQILLLILVLRFHISN